MYQHLFGPVPSRRLGISLGIDLVPHKTCTLNCIYCECGATTDLTLTRREYVPLSVVKEEISHYLANNPKPDYVTFSGSGEPLLNSIIGEVIYFLKAAAVNIPVAVLTNGTMLYEPRVRDEIKEAAIVIPSLDAVSNAAFKQINRPHPQLQIPALIDGLIQFRKEYTGQLWLEIFIVPGVNDTPAELENLKRAIQDIGPDRIQLNTLDRPGAISNIRPATQEELARILDFWQLDNTSVIATAPTRKALASYRKDVASAILETIARRPCTLEDLKKILGRHTNEINKYLDVLEADQKIKVVAESRGFFYRLS